MANPLINWELFASTFVDTENNALIARGESKLKSFNELSESEKEAKIEAVKYILQLYLQAPLG